MKAAPFHYHRPGTVAEAVELLSTHGDEAKLLAGGQSLVPMMALRLASFGHLIDIGRLEELRGVRSDGERVVIGAGTTQATIERSAVIETAVPLLTRATPFIGHFQIRNRGTIGGSLVHCDPAAEYPAVALALDARFDITGPGGARTVEASEFFTGHWATAVAGDEVLTAISFPVASGRSGFAIREFARRQGDFAIAGAAVSLALAADDRISQCAIAMFGLGPTPLRATAVELALAGSPAGETDAAGLGVASVEGLESIPSDLHGSAEYRRRVGAAVVADAWRAALEEALR